MNPDSTVALALRPLFAEQAQGLLSCILGAVDYGILVADLEHTSLACNPRFGELFGIDANAVVQTDPAGVREMVRHRIADFDAWERNLEEVFSDPSAVQSDELALVHPDQLLKRYTGPVRNSKGEVVARLWTFQDRTGDRRLERMREAIHEASLAFHPEPKRVYERITDMVASHYDSVAFLSIRDGDFMTFRAVAGAPPGAPIGKGNPLSDAYCQFCVERREPLIIQDARLDPSAAAILPARFGLTRYAGVPLWAPDGALVGTFCILDGRSDELLDEEDLRFLSVMGMRISTELERERQLTRLERDLETTQSQLVQSEKLAVTGTLAASVAHDIRNILSAISLTLSMGQDEPASALRDLRGHLDRFEVLSHRLLAYSRPQQTVRVPVSILDVVRSATDLLTSHFKVSSVRCDVSIPPNLPAVIADPSRLEHVFVNLILNAIQASPSGALVQVTGCLKGKRLVVEVQDEGHGMDKDKTARLFEPFATNRAKGFGLGLYSCRQILKDSGGDIRVDSAPGRGTTFHLEFPIS